MNVNDGKYIVGVDLGGTTINVGVVPFDGGSVLGMRSVPTDADKGSKVVVDRIVVLIRDAMRDAQKEALIET